MASGPPSPYTRIDRAAGVAARFSTGRITLITASDISAALRLLGVECTDLLFVHSDVRSALRVEGTTVREKLDTLLDSLIGSVPEGVLMLPTFTYSFCRGQDFDIARSPSTVGALTEAFRRREDVWRTADPLFSTAVRGTLPTAWERDLRAVADRDVFGPRSIFALLLEQNAKLLFLGAGFESCTFVHYVERLQQVPYRYMKEFTGTVTDGERRERVTARYYVRRLDQDVENHLDPLWKTLVADGAARAGGVPDGPRLLLTDAASVERAAARQLSAHPDFLLTRGHALAEEVPA